MTKRIKCTACNDTGYTEMYKPLSNEPMRVACWNGCKVGDVKTTNPDLAWLQSQADAGNDHAQSILKRLEAEYNRTEELQMQYEQDMQGVGTLRQIIHGLMFDYQIGVWWFERRGFDVEIYDAICREFDGVGGVSDPSL